jgi:carboxyl-terminal processing protease
MSFASFGSRFSHCLVAFRCCRRFCDGQDFHFQHRSIIFNKERDSAGEMVSAFAEENKLATVVGTKTPGRLLSGSAYKVGHGYILGLPVAAYLTWQGRMLENNGIVPKFSVDLSRDALREGRDTQLETAIEVTKAL